MKAEMKINETIIVIFIVTLLIIIGFVFYTKWHSITIEKEKFNYEKGRFELLIGKIPQMAELQCSSYGQERNCLDTSKMIAFKEVSQDYFSVFGYSNISVVEIYPLANGKECSKSNHSDCGMYSLYYKKKTSLKSTLVISSPVSLYYPDIDEYKIGKLVIEWYT